MFPNRTNEPHLRHAHDRAEDPKAEGSDGGKARREPRGFVVDLGIVPTETPFEDEVFCERHTFVYREPVRLRGVLAMSRTAYIEITYNNQHEVLEDSLEV